MIMCQGDGDVRETNANTSTVNCAQSIGKNDEIKGEDLATKPGRRKARDRQGKGVSSRTRTRDKNHATTAWREKMRMRAYV